MRDRYARGKARLKRKRDPITTSFYYSVMDNINHDARASITIKNEGGTVSFIVESIKGMGYIHVDERIASKIARALINMTDSDDYY